MKKRLIQFETETTTELLWYAKVLYPYFSFCHTEYEIKMSTNRSRFSQINNFTTLRAFVSETGFLNSKCQ